ncbi:MULTISPECIES: hypothetical protein [unclassified Ketobacter]|uniref:hypothetical protein n=1 Tax=unclassified Ketobacter TaxID=2639109 RepID=UPI000F2D611C|nr:MULTISPECIES: hypothetical protein [unclassified Ketobacter]RLT89645.1 MAG: hypothetical protein D9N13_12040 [Ketobacter sp. GenoA1]RLT92398.1 MAG: hypothetical protein D9N15_22770 [Ketobacter sp.]
MDFRIGSVSFSSVKIPLLWGKKAILSHSDGTFSVVDLSGDKAVPQIVGDEPWNEIEYSEKEDGFVIYENDVQAYFYSPPRKIFRDLTGKLPECELGKDFTRIGTNKISGGMVSGFGVGIGVSENGFFMGGPVPEGLASLKL